MMPGIRMYAVFIEVLIQTSRIIDKSRGVFLTLK